MEDYSSAKSIPWRGEVGNRKSFLQDAFGRSDLRIATLKSLGFALLNPTYNWWATEFYGVSIALIVHSLDPSYSNIISGI